MLKKSLLFLLFSGYLLANDTTKEFVCEMHAVNYVPVSDRQKESFGAITKINMSISNIKAVLDWKEDTSVLKYSGNDPRTNLEVYASEDGDKMLIAPDRSAFFMISGNTNINYKCK